MAISDLAVAAEQRSGVPSGWCHVCWWLTQIPESEAESLKRLLANPGVEYTDLSRDLARDKDTPLQIGRDSLSRHARGVCGVEPLRPDQERSR